MATHSSVLAWSIPGMAEPDGLLSRVAQSRTRLKRLSSSSSSSSPRREILMIMAFLPSPSIEHNLPFFKAQHPTSNFDSDDYLNFDKLFQGADSLNSPSTLHTFLQQLWMKWKEKYLCWQRQRVGCVLLHTILRGSPTVTTCTCLWRAYSLAET